MPADGGGAKWWHVPDEQIDELVMCVAAKESAEDAAAGGRCTRRRRSAQSLPPRAPLVLQRDDQITCKDAEERMDYGLAKWWHVPDSAIEELVSQAVAQSTTEADASSSRPTSAAVSTTRPASAVVSRSVGRRSRPPSGAGSVQSGSVRSGRSCSSARSAQRGEGLLTLYVYNLQSSDTLVLKVHQDMRVGPEPPPSPRASLDPVDGSAASQCHSFSSQMSLKGEIEAALGIPVARQRLKHKGSSLGSDERTLRSCGVTSGQTVQLQVCRASSCADRDVVLACTAKRREKEERCENEEMRGLQSYSTCSASARKSLDQRCSQSGAFLMPKWVSQEYPRLFAPVGSAIDGHGNYRVCEEFSSQPIWRADVADPSMERVRAALKMDSRGGRGGA